jgi:hypothetical protein
LRLRFRRQATGGLPALSEVEHSVTLNEAASPREQISLTFESARDSGIRSFVLGMLVLSAEIQARKGKVTPRNKAISAPTCIISYGGAKCPKNGASEGHDVSLIHLRGNPG